MLWTDFLRQSARRVPSKVAIVHGERRLSYAELDAAANQFANALLDLGLPKGARVAIQLVNGSEYAIA